MKKTLILLTVLMLTVTLAYAAVDSGNISVTATLVAGTPDATFVIRKAPNGGNVDYDTPPFTSMNFNRWSIVQKTGKSAQWVGVDHYVVVAYANGMGRKYYIKSLATGAFAYGANPPLPLGSFACIPIYSADDRWVGTDPNTAQGAMPSGALITPGNGIPFMAINAAAQTVYTSETLGSSRIIQVRYGFLPYTDAGTDPYTSYAPILTSQLSGTYTGVTVKVSITQ